MGLFDFLNKKKPVYNSFESLNGAAINTSASMPEHVNSNSGIINMPVQPTENQQANNIDLLFQFLDRNYEVKGYEDALVNADAQYLEYNLAVIKNELERTIRKVKTYYEDFLNEIDFHISSRSRSGLVDTVEELKMKKSIAESHVEKIKEIESDARNNTGVSQGIVMSYTKGFRNGLAAISQNSILKRKL